MHFLTSNFNLMHSNSNWDLLKKNNFYLDADFNNFFWVLNKRKVTTKYSSFHVILNFNNSNYKELIKKLYEIKKIFKNNKDKIFFIYLSIENKKKSFNSKILSMIDLDKIENVFIKDLNYEKQFKFNSRNKDIIKFPYDISAIKILNKNILKNINLVNITPYKLIILDCDNTLWGGILDEDGNQGLIYSNKGKGLHYKNFQKLLKSLKERGFLLSISSKNDEKKVWDTFKKRKMILSKKDFLSPKINWGEKYKNIQNIIYKLGLRPKDCIFIDDNNIEIQKVKNMIRNINVLHLKKISDITNLITKDDRFKKIKVLNEDKRKYKQYEMKSKFEDLKEGYENPHKLIRRMKQKLSFSKCNKSNFDRAIQLFNKVNQFNFSLNRYKNKEMIDILKNKNNDLKLFNFSDKFGNHGIVGSFIIEKNKNSVMIKDFLISCRVLYRYIEDYVIAYILKKYKNYKIYILYKSTKINNKLVPIFLKKKFFKLNNKIKNKHIYEVKYKRELKYANKAFKK